MYRTFDKTGFDVHVDSQNIAAKIMFINILKRRENSLSL